MSGMNIAHSVRQRLLNLSKKSSEDFQVLLIRYAVERLLYRLARSEHRDHFVLSGMAKSATWRRPKLLSVVPCEGCRGQRGVSCLHQHFPGTGVG